MSEQQTEQQPSQKIASDEGANPQGGAMPPTFDAWLGGQDEQIKGLVNSRFRTMENTIKATRQERDEFAKQLRDLIPKAEKGSEMEKSLTEVTTKLELAEKRAMFAEQAIRPEIGCSNPKAAYALAVADGLFDRKGNPDWDAIKTNAPELFIRTQKTKTHAGDGTGTEPPSSMSMNEFIRQAAGRRL